MCANLDSGVDMRNNPKPCRKKGEPFGGHRSPSRATQNHPTTIASYLGFSALEQVVFAAREALGRASTAMTTEPSEHATAPACEG